MNQRLLKRHRLAPISALIVSCVMVALLILAWQQDKIHFSGDILAALPSQQHRDLEQQRASDAFYQRSQSRLMFSISGEHAIVSAKHLATALADIDGLTLDLPEVPEFKQLITFYSQYPGALSSLNYQQQTTSSQAVNDYFFSQLTRLNNPFVSATLADDPSLSTAAFLEHIMSQHGGLTVEQGVLTTEFEGQKVALLLYDVAPQYQGINASVQLSDQLRSAMSFTQAVHPVTIANSGFVFHTAANAMQAEYEITVLGGISVLLLLVVVLMIFRSVTPIILASLTILMACLFGFVALVWLFDHVQLLSLVFAMTLIGIAIDYCFHALTDANHSHSGSMSLSTQKAMVIGFVTTCLGYLLLCLSPLAILKQVAVFVIFGLFGALVFALFALVPLYKRLNKTRSGSHTLPAIKLQWFAKNGWMITGSALLMAGLLLMFKSITFNDDIRLLNGSPSALMANEKQNLAVLGKLSQRHYLVWGNDLQQALERQETLQAWLDVHATSAQLDGLARWLPSFVLQQKNLQNFEQKRNSGYFTDISAQLGLVMPAEPPKQLLTPESFSDSVLSQLMPLYVVHQGQKTALWVALSGVDERTHQAILAEHRSLQALAKGDEITEVLGHYRVQLMWVIVAMVVASCSLFLWIFDGATALRSLVVFSVSAWVTLALANAIQGHLNVFNLLSLILLFALAIDYMVFYRSQRLKSSAVLAITLSAVSSALVFGMLIWSHTPAVYSFGLTLMIGLLVIYLLSPQMIGKEDANTTL